MRRIIPAILITLVLLTSACGGRESAVQESTGDYYIEVQPETDPPTVGVTTLLITLTDPAGKPVDNATINVRGDMHHAGMIPEFGEADTSTDGVYEIPFNWSMAGSWILEITATLPDDQGVAEVNLMFSVEADSSE
jgi:hypothetical protein